MDVDLAYEGNLPKGVSVTAKDSDYYTLGGGQFAEGAPDFEKSFKIDGEVAGQKYDKTVGLKQASRRDANDKLTERTLTITFEGQTVTSSCFAL